MPEQTEALTKNAAKNEEEDKNASGTDSDSEDEESIPELEDTAGQVYWMHKTKETLY